jgi:hypothetical protein
MDNTTEVKDEVVARRNYFPGPFCIEYIELE